MLSFSDRGKSEWKKKIDSGIVLRQTAGSKRIHAIQTHYKRMVLFINLPGKGLTQEISGGMDAPSHELLLSIICLYQFCFLCWQEKFSYLQPWLNCWGILQHNGEREFCTWLLSKQSVARVLELVSLCRFWQSINQSINDFACQLIFSIY